MKILVIHNEKNEVRKKHFLSQFANQGIVDFEIIPADMRPASPATGISISHKKAVKRAIELDLDEVLIMEDDVLFTNPQSFRKFLHTKTHLSENWDGYFGGIYTGKIEPMEFGISKIIGRLAGMHAYFLNRRFYEKFLSTENHYNIDYYISHKIGGNFYVCDPFQIIQVDGYSDNIKNVTQYLPYLRTQYKIDE
jgi:GR25 family glycosyltransferase involved in LPS biosynthesis